MRVQELKLSSAFTPADLYFQLIGLDSEPNSVQWMPFIRPVPLDRHPTAGLHSRRGRFAGNSRSNQVGTQSVTLTVDSCQPRIKKQSPIFSTA